MEFSGPIRARMPIIPILLLSGYKTRFNQEDLAARSIVDRIAKPLQRRLIWINVRKGIDQAKSRGTSTHFRANKDVQSAFSSFPSPRTTG
jgi:hypothetical protein